MSNNRRVILAAIPEGAPKLSDFRVEQTDSPSCPDGGLLVRTNWISVDPYLRGRISGKRSYVDPIPVGEPMVSGAVGEVVESRNPSFHSGDIVTGMWAWQEVAEVPSVSGVQKVDPNLAPVSTALGVLGMPGMTAYFGLTELCQPRAGETLVVSGAAGAVGSAVGQIGKILGCRVIGTTGSPDKAEYLRSIGFDGVLNYRTDEIPSQLRSLCPDGIDCYFDNVGGEITDAVFPLLNTSARVAVCGQISQYNSGRGSDVGPRPFWHMVVKQIRCEGFLVFRWYDRFAEGQQRMAQWLRSGKLQYKETVYEGLENAPKAFLGLFEGENTGKALVRL